METYTTGLASGLKKRGWDVHLIVTHSPVGQFEALRTSIVCHDLSNTPLSLRKVREFGHLVNKISPQIFINNFSTLAHYASPYLIPSIKTITVIHNDVELFYRTASLLPGRTWRWVAPTPRIKTGISAYLGPLHNARAKIVPHGVDVRTFQRPMGAKVPSYALDREVWTRFPSLNGLHNEDVILAFRALLLGGFTTIEEPLVDYRVHGNSASIRFDRPHTYALDIANQIVVISRRINQIDVHLQDSGTNGLLCTSSIPVQTVTKRLGQEMLQMRALLTRKLLQQRTISLSPMRHILSIIRGGRQASE